jgi:predicted MFS family arabinose efflux permease
VLLDTLQSAFGGLFVSLVINFAAVYARRLDASPALLSVLLAAPFTGALVSPIVVARLPASVSPRRIALLIGIGRLLVLAVPLTSSAAVFIALMLGMYLFGTLPSPYIVDTMGRLYPAAIRGRYIGYSRIALTVGLVVGAPIGGFVLDSVGPAVLFPIGAVVGLLGAFAYAGLRPGPEVAARTPPSVRSTFSLVRQDPPYAVAVVALAIWGFGVLIAGPFYPVILVNRFGVSYEQVGFLSLVQSACWFLSYLYLARRIDRLPAVVVLAVSMLLSAMLPLAYLFAPSPTLLSVGYAANGFSAGGVDLALLQVLVRAAPPGRTPQYTALLNAVAGARGIAAPFVGSALGADNLFGTSGVLAAGSVMCVAGTVLALRATKRPYSTGVKPSVWPGGAL